MKKTLLIATILSYSSFSLPANAYKNSIYLDNPDTLNSIFAKNFTLAQNNSLNNSEGSGGSSNSEGSGGSSNSGGSGGSSNSGGSGGSSGQN